MASLQDHHSLSSRFASSSADPRARDQDHEANQPARRRPPSSPPIPTTAPADAQQQEQRILEQQQQQALHAAQAAENDYLPNHPRSLAGIALRSFALGLACAAGLAAAAYLLLSRSSPAWPPRRLARLPLFLTALATFHFLEFWTTARYNPAAAKVSSFLLQANWPGYAVAHAAAALECLLVGLVWPARSWAPPRLGPLPILLGAALVVAGQAVRSLAMAEAGRSFNHIVQHRRAAGHELVTRGVYGVWRHPSYFGFFWWALGTQLVLGNVVCFCGYAAVLWRFFSARIRHEEEFLVQFFGHEYVEYRKRVGTWIPFIR